MNVKLPLPSGNGDFFMQERQQRIWQRIPRYLVHKNILLKLKWMVPWSTLGGLY